MLHQRLLPAFHLIMRSSLCINGYMAAVRTTGYGGVPQGGVIPSFPSRSRCSLIGCFQPLPKRSMCCYSRSTRNSSSQLFNHDTPKERKYGPVIHRSQSPTHLDHVEDAIKSSLLHYQRAQQQIKSSSNNDDEPQNNFPPPDEPIMLDRPQSNILNFPPEDRETIGVASNLQRRLRGLSNSGDCRRCWLQKRHCVCEYCVPLEEEEGNDESSGMGLMNVNRLFLLVSDSLRCFGSTIIIIYGLGMFLMG